ncbi:DUF4430 domain-containing protein [Clostridium paraputrificum]|uniref:Transcobalamin-like C-terminal domain-containing protein n=1 Tax=Clostridium paraputrificum TaxID=29363 RepID=A0A6N3C4R6_9CLOT
MKKYWKGIIICICLVVASFIGIKGCKIEVPKDNTIVESSDEKSYANEEKEDTTKVEEGNDNIKPEDKIEKEEEKTSSTLQVKDEDKKEPEKPNLNTTDKAENTDVVKDEKRYVTLSIRCDTILDNMDKFNMEKKDYINNGVILSSTKVELTENDKTVFDLLYRVTRGKRIPIDYSGNKNNAYIKGINHIYEFDCGKQSGWMYRVNGSFPNYGVGNYNLNGGENIEFLYTCDLGYDIGGGY